MRSLAAAVLALVLLGDAPAPAPAPSSATASPSPSPSPSAAPAASPSPAPAPTESPTPSPYHYVIRPPSPAPGMPAILEIDLLDQTLHPGAPYSVRVKTSLDVTTLNVAAMGSAYGMQAAGPGLFASDGTVPSGVPFFLLDRSYELTVTALTADGRSTSVPVPLRLAR